MDRFSPASFSHLLIALLTDSFHNFWNKTKNLNVFAIYTFFYKLNIQDKRH